MKLFLKFKTVILLFTTLFILTGCASHPTQSKENISGYVNVDHGKLFYQSFGAGTPIIVLHGGPGLDQSYLLPQMLALAKNHQVIFYDQRGSGKSLATIMSPTYINTEQFVKDLEVLRKHFGFKKFVLIGHSWGGLLAMNYAIAHPHHIAALILLNTAPADFKGQQAFVKEFNRRTLLIKDKISPLFDYAKIKQLNAAEIHTLYKTLFSIYFYDPQKVAQLTLNIPAKSAQQGTEVMALMLKTSWLRPANNLLPQLSKLNIPTLIIQGKQDIVPLWTAQAIAKAIPHAQLVILPTCGHFSYIEKPHQVFFNIDSFLTKVKN